MNKHITKNWPQKCFFPKSFLQKSFFRKSVVPSSFLNDTRVCLFSFIKYNWKSVCCFHTCLPYFKKKQKDFILQLAKKTLEEHQSDNKHFSKIKKIWKLSKTYTCIIDDLEIYKELLKEKEKEKEKENKKDEEEINEKDDEDIKQLYKTLENVEEALFEEILQFYKSHVNEEHHLETDEIKMEIFPGVGGHEAKLFSKELFGMYEKYCQLQNYDYDIISNINDEIKGSRNIVCYIKGQNVYENFIHESGIHRVQRIPVNCNKIQTSTAIVLICDEKTYRNKIEKKIKISKNDLIIETKRSGGPGGQSVNKNESCVKVLHKPTNIFVEVQKTSSQMQNKSIALELLKNKLYQYYYEKEKDELVKNKKKQKLSGDRSEKIRTYNFLHNTVTDHILNEEFYDIDLFFKGNNLLQLIEKRKQHFYENIVQETLSHILSIIDT